MSFQGEDYVFFLWQERGGIVDFCYGFAALVNLEGETFNSISHHYCHPYNRLL